MFYQHLYFISVGDFYIIPNRFIPKHITLYQCTDLHINTYILISIYIYIYIFKKKIYIYIMSSHLFL